MTQTLANPNAKEQAQPKPPIEVGQRGLVLRSLDDMYRFARYVAASGLAPKGLEKPEAILVALQYGFELGLSPAQALQNIAVINGRPSLWGDTMLALCMANPAWDHEVFHEWFEGKPGTEQYRACCRVGRKGRKEPVVREFSVAQAKKAGLLGKPGPWQQFPERMLQMRARSWALRDAFPDVLRGCLAAEELIGVSQPVESRPAGVAALAEKLAEPQQPQAVEAPVAEGGEAIETEHPVQSEPVQGEEVDSLLEEFQA